MENWNKFLSEQQEDASLEANQEEDINTDGEEMGDSGYPPSEEKKEILIVGDSIATGIIVAAQNKKLINEPQCGGPRAWYGSCSTATAHGGKTAEWTIKQLNKFFNSKKNEAGDSGLQKLMIVSAGTNDGIQWAKKNLTHRYNPEKCIENIKKIQQLGSSKGYKVKFKLIGPLYRRVRWGDRFNIFAKTVNKIIMEYSYFDASGVSHADFVHPSRAGSRELLERALVD